MKLISHILGQFLAALIWKLLWNHALASLFHSAVVLTYGQALALVFALNLLVYVVRAMRS
jgi:hypothetical protein